MAFQEVGPVLFEIAVSDGKYTFQQMDENEWFPWRCLRHGTPWLEHEWTCNRETALCIALKATMPAQERPKPDESPKPDKAKSDPWEAYLREHRQEIVDWMKRFAPTQARALVPLLDAPVFGREMAFKVLQDAWFAAPESPDIREPGFFKLCNLLDGGVEF